MTRGSVGVGFNSTTAYTGFRTLYNFGPSSGPVDAIFQASYMAAPSLGINTVTALEAATGSITYLGTESNMVLSAQYRG